MKIRISWRLHISLVLIFVLALSGLGVNATYYPECHGLHKDYYYRIRLSSTNLYLQAGYTFGHNPEGVLLTLNNRSSSYSQYFKLECDGSGACYLKPKSTPSYAIGIANLSNINIFGTNAILTSNVNNSKLKFSRSENGLFQIKPYSASSTAFIVNSTTNGYPLVLGSNSLDSSYIWVLEPAYSGDCDFFRLKLLDENLSNLVLQSNSMITDLGYSTYSHIYPEANSFLNKLSTSRIAIINGHGSPGFFECTNDVGTPVFICSSENPAGALTENFSFTIDSEPEAWSGKDYLFIGACKSAQDDTDKRSLVAVAYEKGNNCVTGFHNIVVSSPVYWSRMALSAYSEHIAGLYPSISQLMSAADDTYSIYERLDSECAANINNRLTVGNTSIILDMTS